MQARYLEHALLKIVHSLFLADEGDHSIIETLQ